MNGILDFITIAVVGWGVPLQFGCASSLAKNVLSRAPCSKTRCDRNATGTTAVGPPRRQWVLQHPRFPAMPLGKPQGSVLRGSR